MTKPKSSTTSLAVAILNLPLPVSLAKAILSHEVATSLRAADANRRCGNREVCIYLAAVLESLQSLPEIVQEMRAKLQKQEEITEETRADFQAGTILQ